MSGFPRLPDKLLDPTLTLVIVAVSLLELQLPSMTEDDRAPLAIVLVCAPVLIRRWSPFAALLAVAAAAALSPDFTGGFPSTPSIAVALVFYSVAAHARSRFALAAAAVTFLVLEATVGVRSDALVPIVIGTWGPYWIGAQVRARREMVDALSERAREIAEDEDTFKRLSLRRERARIGRELHDIVSHHLAMIVVQAGAGRISTAGGPSRAAERFTAIRHGGEQALSELARLVDVLHADDAERPRVQRLLDQASTRDVPLRVTGWPMEASLPREAEDVLYRVLQEGLTNVLKHAPASDVHLRFAERDETVEIELFNTDSPGSSLAAAGSGLGLTGMRDRVEGLGGEFDAGPASDGWRLRAVLPLRVLIAAAGAPNTPEG